MEMRIKRQILKSLENLSKGNFNWYTIYDISLNSGLSLDEVKNGMVELYGEYVKCNPCTTGEYRIK